MSYRFVNLDGPGAYLGVNGVCVQNQKTKMSAWSSTIFKMLLVAALPADVWAYKVLMIPLPGKSHVFSMAAMAEGLVNRGHKVTFFIGENFPLNLPELKNRTEFSVVRYNDSTDGVNMNYGAGDDALIQEALDSGNDNMRVASTLKTMYVNFIYYEN